MFFLLFPLENELEVDVGEVGEVRDEVRAHVRRAGRRALLELELDTARQQLGRELLLDRFEVVEHHGTLHVLGEVLVIFELAPLKLEVEVRVIQGGVDLLGNVEMGREEGEGLVANVHVELLHHIRVDFRAIGARELPEHELVNRRRIEARRRGREHNDVWDGDLGMDLGQASGDLGG